MPQIHRTRFKQDIVAEFLFPRTPSTKVIIFCDGMPSLPSKKQLMTYWAKKGYWVIHPRYRGTWESGGEFLQDSPEKDILNVVDELSQGLTSLWDGVHYALDPKEIYLIGGSFGGAAAILASRDPRITKVVVVSPVVDWTAPSPEEPLHTFGITVQQCFGYGYRFTQANWNKLLSGNFYNPVRHTGEIDGQKLMIIHAADDMIVTSKEVVAFAEKTKSTIHLLKRGGHLSSRMLTRWPWSRRVKKFFS